jgi:enoyl-CoA hydratase
MTVDVERHEAVMLVRLNRPEAANAFDPATALLVGEAFREATANDEIRAVILTGSGGRAFCAGMDLKAFAEGQDMMPVADALDLIPACPKPVVAAINGAAVAGGFELMMRCDLVVAADHARFGIPEVKRGLVAAGGGTRLASRIPLVVAMELGLTGDLIDAERAFNLGLVNRVVPAADVVPTALDIANRIASNGPLAVRATKQLMHDERGGGNPDLIRELSSEVSGGNDALEGARAFAEKRDPVWTGT